MNSIGALSLLLVVGRDDVEVALVGGKKETALSHYLCRRALKVIYFLDIYASRVIVAKITSGVDYKHHLLSSPVDACCSTQTCQHTRH